MAYLRMVLMLKAMSVRMARVWSHWLALRARVMAARSARFMVCRSGCDFISICVVVCELGLTMDGVTNYKGAVCVDVCFWVPRRTIWAYLGGLLGVVVSWVWKGMSLCKLGCYRVGHGLLG